MKFAYRKEKSKLLGVIYRSVIEFEINTKIGWIPIWAYIDSGADITLLPKSFIELLGVSFKEEDIVKIGGVGGDEVPVVLKESELKICEQVIKCKVAIALVEEVPYLLGRESIFPHFEICFRQKLNEVNFKPEE